MAPKLNSKLEPEELAEIYTGQASLLSISKILNGCLAFSTSKVLPCFHRASTHYMPTCASAAAKAQ